MNPRPPPCKGGVLSSLDYGPDFGLLSGIQRRLLKSLLLDYGRA